MRKLKIALPIVTLLYFFIGAFFFMSAYSADDIPEPTVPTIVGWSYDEMTLTETPELWVGVYNPAINEAVNPYVGQTVCSVETSLTFPKDLIEVQSTSFASNDANNYSNTDGTINFKAEISPCTTYISIDLFNVTFKTKQIGTGTIHFTKNIMTGGNGASIPSAVYSDIPVSVVPIEEYNPDPIVDPLPDIPASIPQPKVQTVPKSTSKSTSSTSATEKTATKTENKAFKIPALTKLEFSPAAVLDKSGGKSQGAVFTGTAEPNSKVYILIHSQAEIYTDTTSGADGNWTKTIDSWLEDGSHTISAWSEKDNKISQKLDSKFVISSYAKDQIAIGDTYPEYKGGDAVDSGLKTKKDSKLNSLMKNKYFWVYVGAGLLLIIICIVLIVKSKKKNNIDDQNLTGNGGFINQSAMPPETKDNQDSINKIYPNTPI